MLIAVDTNVLLDMADGVDDVVDALAIIRHRIKAGQIIASPTVNIELAYLAQFAGEVKLRGLARSALQAMTSRWKIKPVNLVPVGHGIVNEIGAKIRNRNILPDEEEHDALILAEAALLDCSFLLTSDAHLRGIDFQQLTIVLQNAHLGVPIIATPREIVRKFGS